MARFEIAASMKRVAVVVPHLLEGGGIPAVARFITHALEEADDFEPVLISLATSSRDAASVRISKPSSWLGGPRTVSASWEGRSCTHVGCRLAEVETARYMPRSALTRELETCDLIQVVAGTPAWTLAALGTSCPVALQVATLVAEERKAVSSGGAPLLRVWRRVMTGVTAAVESIAPRLADLIFVENRWMYRKLRGRTRGRVVLAPPGVDTRLFRPRRDPQEAGAERYLLSVARLDEPRKRVDLLVESYALLRAETDRAPRLILAGSSPPSGAVRARIRELGLGDCVEYRANPSREKLAALYRGAELFVLASAEEGLGIVLLEAQASGLPVVATRTRGAETAVQDGETGLLTRLGSPHSLAKAMGRLLADPCLRRRMGRSARQRVEAHFSESVASRRFLDEYQRLLA